MGFALEAASDAIRDYVWEPEESLKNLARTKEELKGAIEFIDGAIDPETRVAGERSA
jgi:hypothetical protein